MEHLKTNLGWFFKALAMLAAGGTAAGGFLYGYQTTNDRVEDVEAEVEKVQKPLKDQDFEHDVLSRAIRERWVAQDRVNQDIVDALRAVEEELRAQSRAIPGRHRRGVVLPRISDWAMEVLSREIPDREEGRPSSRGNERRSRSTR